MDLVTTLLVVKDVTKLPYDTHTPPNDSTLNSFLRSDKFKQLWRNLWLGYGFFLIARYMETK